MNAYYPSMYDYLNLKFLYPFSSDASKILAKNPDLQFLDCSVCGKH